jgi:hypothetical protein
MKFAARLAAQFAVASFFTLVMAGQTAPSPNSSAPDKQHRRSTFREHWPDIAVHVLHRHP